MTTGGPDFTTTCTADGEPWPCETVAASMAADAAGAVAVDGQEPAAGETPADPPTGDLVDDPTTPAVDPADVAADPALPA